MSDANLLPCPFCGGEAAMDDIGGMRPLFTIGCNNNACLVESNVHSVEGYDAIIGAWNTRATIHQADPA